MFLSWKIGGVLRPKDQSEKRHECTVFNVVYVIWTKLVIMVLGRVLGSRLHIPPNFCMSTPWDTSQHVAEHSSLNPSIGK